MDQKSRPWRKRSSHKTIFSSSKSDLSPKESGDEMNTSGKDLYSETTLESLNEKLESVVHDHESEAKGKEKAEKEATSLRQEIDKALLQKVASNERMGQLNLALKESMQQLSSIREDHDKKVRDAVMKTSREFEKAQRRLEEKLSEKSQSLANLILENAHLNKALVVNEKFIEDLSKRKSEAEMGCNTLMDRLDLVEKENAFLKYELRMLEKELDVRTEESEFHRQSADVSRRQHMDSLKKITKLENECQRLRVLVRKRFPGPLAISKMRENTIRSSNDISDKKISALIDRLCDLEEENKTLKEVIAKKDDELCTKSTSDFSQIEAQLEELSKGQKRSMELARLSTTSKEFSPRSNFENENKSFGGSEMSLMDDFVEMEKLAIVSSDEKYIDSKGKELVCVGQSQSNDNWLENVLKLILDQNNVSKTSFDDLLEDIRIALSYMKSSNNSKANKEDPLVISGYITWKSPNTSPRKSSVIRRLNFDKYESEFKILGTENESHETLMNQLQESEKTIAYLEKEIDSLKESKGEAEDMIDNQKLINEDLDTQLTVSKGKLNEVLQKLSALEVELEDKSCCYEELEGTCVDLQLQLESLNKKDVPKEDVDEDENLLQTGWEITAASTKLAECQETILNLGKQLKALASPNDTLVFDKKLNQRSTLRDHILAEDGFNAEDPPSPKNMEIVAYEDVRKSPAPHSENEPHVENKSAVMIVPITKRGGVGFWGKLLLRKKRGCNNKTPRLCAP